MCHVTFCSQSDSHIIRDTTIMCHVILCSQSDPHIIRAVYIVYISEIN